MKKKNNIDLEFLMQKPEIVMSLLERKGEWTAPSEIYNTGYCAIGGRFIILQGRYGVVAIRNKDIRALANELLEYADILEFRKDAHIVGA